MQGHPLSLFRGPPMATLRVARPRSSDPASRIVWCPSFHGHCQNSLPKATCYIAENSEKYTKQRSECKIGHGRCVDLPLAPPVSSAIRRPEMPVGESGSSTLPSTRLFSYGREDNKQKEGGARRTFFSNPRPWILLERVWRVVEI
jgi:hypothetical protein